MAAGASDVPHCLGNPSRRLAPDCEGGVKLRMAKAEYRPLTAEQHIRFEAACTCADLAAEAFLREDYVSSCRWWIEAAQEATTTSGKRACIGNAILAWSLVPNKTTVH